MDAPSGRESLICAALSASPQSDEPPAGGYPPDPHHDDSAHSADRFCKSGLARIFTYCTVTGFHYNVSSIGRSAVPFLTVADHYLGGLAILAWLAGIVSVLATPVAGANSQARMLFDGGHRGLSGLLPAWLGRVRARDNTPVHALLGMAGVGLAIIARWWISQLLGVNGGGTNAVGLYAECSTMGTIVIRFVYFLTTQSLPIFMWSRHRQSFSALRHVAVPTLGHRP